MSDIVERPADPDAVLAAIARIENLHIDPAKKLEKTLGWSNERLRVAVQELAAMGKVGAILNNNEGGTPKLEAFQVL